jgi:hypothetical protein
MTEWALSEDESFFPTAVFRKRAASFGTMGPAPDSGEVFLRKVMNACIGERLITAPVFSS